MPGIQPPRGYPANWEKNMFAFANYFPGSQAARGRGPVALPAGGFTPMGPAQVSAPDVASLR